MNYLLTTKLNEVKRGRTNEVGHEEMRLVMKNREALW